VVLGAAQRCGRSDSGEVAAGEGQGRGGARLRIHRVSAGGRS
jgi:hypothetical protein